MLGQRRGVPLDVRGDFPVRQRHLVLDGAVDDPVEVPEQGQAAAGGELHGDIEQAVGAGVLGPFEWREGCLGGLEVGMDLQVGLAVGHHLVTQAGDVHRACDKRFGRGKSRLGNQACRDRSLELVALPVRRLGLEQLAPRDVDSVAVELARAGDSELRTGIDHPAGRVGEIDIADRILE